MIPMRSVNPLAEQEARYSMTSPLLFGVLQALDPETRIEVLELAPATAGLLDYFSQFHSKLYLPGCRDELLALCVNNDEDAPPLSRIFNRCIPWANSNNTLDLILLWDLPNYLDKQVLSGLITHLAPHVTKRTVVHTYIHTRQTMPAHPGDYQLTHENNVTVDLAAAWNASSPMYYQELINKVFAPFRVQRGMLLANGLQEYILRT